MVDANSLGHTVSRVNEECNKTVGANLVSGYLIRVKYR